jgi:lactoylglutathione lyase
LFLHVRLKVRDMSRSVEFYTTQLGFKKVDEKTSPRGSQLTFLEYPNSPTLLELAYLPWDPDFKLEEDIFHLAFGLENLPVQIETMRQAGVKITDEPMETRPGRFMAFIEDPDGYEIELLSI